MTKVLLLVRCQMDDIPLKLYDTIKEAEGDAAILAKYPTFLEGALYTAGEVMGIDVSEPVAIALVTYADADMLSLRVVQTLDED